MTTHRPAATDEGLRAKCWAHPNGCTDPDEPPNLTTALAGLPPTPWRFTWSSDSQAGGPGNRTWMLLGADDRYIATFATTPPGADCPDMIRRLGEGLAALGNAAPRPRSTRP